MLEKRQCAALSRLRCLATMRGWLNVNRNRESGKIRPPNAPRSVPSKSMRPIRSTKKTGQSRMTRLRNLNYEILSHPLALCCLTSTALFQLFRLQTKSYPEILPISKFVHAGPVSAGNKQSAPALHAARISRGSYRSRIAISEAG